MLQPRNIPVQNPQQQPNPQAQQQLPQGLLQQAQQNAQNTQVPPEKRDHVPALLSPGEGVFTAEEMKWHGLKTFAKMKEEAKQGINQLKQGGVIKQPGQQQPKKKKNPLPMQPNKKAIQQFQKQGVQQKPRGVQKPTGPLAMPAMPNQPVRMADGGVVGDQSNLTMAPTGTNQPVDNTYRTSNTLPLNGIIGSSNPNLVSSNDAQTQTFGSRVHGVLGTTPRGSGGNSTVPGGNTGDRINIGTDPSTLPPEETDLGDLSRRTGISLGDLAGVVATGVTAAALKSKFATEGLTALKQFVTEKLGIGGSGVPTLPAAPVTPVTQSPLPGSTPPSGSTPTTTPNQTPSGEVPSWVPEPFEDTYREVTDFLNSEAFDWADLGLDDIMGDNLTGGGAIAGVASAAQFGAGLHSLITGQSDLNTFSNLAGPISNVAAASGLAGGGIGGALNFMASNPMAVFAMNPVAWITAPLAIWGAVLPMIKGKGPNPRSVTSFKFDDNGNLTYDEYNQGWSPSTGIFGSPDTAKLNGEATVKMVDVLKGMGFTVDPSKATYGDTERRRIDGDKYSIGDNPDTLGEAASSPMIMISRMLEDGVLVPPSSGVSREYLMAGLLTINQEYTDDITAMATNIATFGNYEGAGANMSLTRDGTSTPGGLTAMEDPSMKAIRDAVTDPLSYSLLGDQQNWHQSNYTDTWEPQMYDEANPTTPGWKQYTGGGDMQGNYFWYDPNVREGQQQMVKWWSGERGGNGAGTEGSMGGQAGGDAGVGGATL